MRSKSVTAKSTFKIVKAAYFLIGVGITVPLTIIFLTNGTLKIQLLENIWYFLSLLLVPMFFAYVGLYHFFFVDDHYVVSLHSKCVLLGEHYTRFNTKVELPRDHIVSYHEHHYVFGLKKELCVAFEVNGKEKKQRFNISMLSKKELNMLRKYLDSVVNDNKKIKE